MGVLLSDIVKALFPEHAAAGHEVNFAPRPVIDTSGTPAAWRCSCGHVDVLMPEEITRAIQENLVTFT